MKVFVFTYDRPTTITTSAALEAEGIDHHVLCHSAEAVQEYKRAGRVKAARLINTGQPKGLANNRNAALDMMSAGEWAVWLVDDFIRCTALDTWTVRGGDLPVTTSTAAYWQRRFKSPLALKTLMERAPLLAALAAERGYNLVGFGNQDNALFRARHYRHWALADGRAWIVRKTHLTFGGEVQLIDDTYWKALNLETFGGVLIDEWILPLCSRYTRGGYGSIEQRLPQKRAEAAWLVKRFPALVTYRDKKNWPRGTHVAIRALPRSAQ